MRREKGVSMISLIITIICIILLSALAIGTGTRYLKESNEKSKQGFISVLSNAVSKRQEDIHLNSAMYPYLGYHISDATFFEDVILPKVREQLDFESGIWYLVDTKTAINLGVKEPDNYIDNINDGGEYNNKITVALVNYATGEAYLIDISSSESNLLPDISDDVITGHVHRYLIEEPTCTQPVKCADCGFILMEALGHEYDASTTPTPVPGDEENTHYNKICKRCGMAGGFEAHIFEYEWMLLNGQWSHKKKCRICGYPNTDTSAELCRKQYTLPTNEAEKAVSHIITCSVCGHTETVAHTLKYRRVSESLHEIYCSDSNCGYVVGIEFHVDANNDSQCDKCNSEIIDFTYPKLKTVVMINKSATTDEGKYIAKYGDTVQLTMTADKQVQNVVMRIAGQTIANLKTTDNITWIAELTLNKDTINVPNGPISLYINCDTKNSGVEMLVPVTETTDGKYVIFDGTPPAAEYVDKENRVDEFEKD